MRLNAFVAAASISAAFFGVAGAQSVHAQSQNDQKPIQVNMPKVAVKPKIVTVKPGDYLVKIAKDHNTTYPRVFSANPKIKDPDLIYPGDKIRIPAPSEKLKDRMPESQTVKAATPAVASSYKTYPKVYSRYQYRYSAPKVNYTTPVYGGVWDKIAACESGGNWSINTGNGYYGGLQFTLASWRGVGGSGYPNQASKAEQISRAKILQARQGWGAWPACTAKLGLR